MLQVSPSEALTEVPEITKSSMTKDMTDLYNQVNKAAPLKIYSPGLKPVSLLYFKKRNHNIVFK